jgi:hypothetical protein
MSDGTHVNMARAVTIQHYSPAELLRSTAPLPYTSDPWALFFSDIALFVINAWSIPFVVWPFTPCNSGRLDELYPSRANIFDLTVHVVLALAQLTFLVSIPLCGFFPVPFSVVILYVIGFLITNYLLCKVLLNGLKPTLESQADISHFPDPREDEMWIFLVSSPRRIPKPVKSPWQPCSR